MNVKIAAQTFSENVATTMETFLISKDRLFAGCTATIRFIRNMNKLFDIFNAKHVDSNNPWKVGLTKENSEEIFSFLNDMIHYIKSLKLRGENILESDRATGFLGFLINIESLKTLFTELISTKRVSVILPFYLGQDLLESLFSRFRGLLGGNDNPTAQQLMGVIRKVAVENEFNASGNANCEDNLNILCISSSRSASKPGPTSEHFRMREIELPDIYAQKLEFKEILTIKLRAGTVENRLKCQKNMCKECILLIENSEKIRGTFPNSTLSQRPCFSTMEICEIAYKVISNIENFYHFNYKMVHAEILNINYIERLFNNFNTIHDSDIDIDTDHKTKLISFIIDEYIRIHLSHLAKCLTLDNQTEYIGKKAKKYKHAIGQ